MTKRVRSKTHPNKKCLIIGPIGNPDSQIRKHADKVLKQIIEPALKPQGYSCTRADHISKSGSITLQLLDEIRDSDLIIADLSYNNANAFYELGIGHALGKPVIPIIRSDFDIPFDVRDFRTICFEPKTRQFEKVIKKLRDHVISVEKDEYSNPISDELQKSLIDFTISQLLDPNMINCKREIIDFVKNFANITTDVECPNTLDVLLSDRLIEAKESFHDRIFLTRLNSYAIAVTKSLEHLIKTADKSYEPKSKKLVKVFATSLLCPKEWYDGLRDNNMYKSEIEKYRKSFDARSDKTDLTRVLIIKPEEFKDQKRWIARMIHDHETIGFKLKYLDREWAYANERELLVDFVEMSNHKEKILLKLAGSEQLGEKIDLQILDDKSDHFTHFTTLIPKYENHVVDVKEAYKEITGKDYKKDLKN